MLQRKSALKPAGASPGAAAPKEPNITIVAVDDVLVHPARDPRNVKMLGSFAMKAGARMAQFYQTSSKTKASFESEGEEDTMTYKQKFECETPGDGLDINEFIAEWTGVNAIIIYGSCSDNFRKVIGTKCAPVQLKASGQDDNEARKKMLVFEQFAKSGFLPGHYTGALVLAEPFAPATPVFAINEANGNQYQIPSLAVTAAIAPSSAALPDGQIVTMIGGGGVGPATLSQGTAGDVKILLKTGSTWTALLNSVIHLQVFDAGDSKYLVELSRN
jgi:hypothetical protein